MLTFFWGGSILSTIQVIRQLPFNMYREGLFISVAVITAITSILRIPVAKYVVETAVPFKTDWN